VDTRAELQETGIKAATVELGMEEGGWGGGVHEGRGDGDGGRRVGGWTWSDAERKEPTRMRMEGAYLHFVEWDAAIARGAKVAFFPIVL
jgi:hypothetical protein